MRFEITLDETILQDLFEPSYGDPERRNRANRMEEHVLVGSQELLQVWTKLRTKPTVRLHYQNWITMMMQKPSALRLVKARLSDVQGEPTQDQRAVLGTAYHSADKIVVGDYPEELRMSNPELTFVSKDAFSKPRESLITWDQIETVFLRSSNDLEHLFDIFETPIAVEVPDGSDAGLLADYLNCFYDDELVIQDEYFVKSDMNEENFITYVLSRLPRGCQITLRARIDRQTRPRGNDKRRRYESMTDRSIRLVCLERRQENLHEGYFETSKYRISIPYRLAIFGTGGKTLTCMIHINRK